MLMLATSTFIGLAVFWPASRAGAEYRAYELRIDNSTTGKSYTVISFLDHLQYTGYYPLNKDDTVHYVDSWMCWENSSQFKKPCAKPERKPAAATAAKTAAPAKAASP